MLLVRWLLLPSKLAFTNSANCWHPKLKLSLLSYGLWDCSLWPGVIRMPSAKVFLCTHFTPTQGMGMWLYFHPVTLPMLQACRSMQSKEFYRESVAADFAFHLKRINNRNVPCLHLHPSTCTGHLEQSVRKRGFGKHQICMLPPGLPHASQQPISS